MECVGGKKKKSVHRISTCIKNKRKKSANLQQLFQSLSVLCEKMHPSFFFVTAPFGGLLVFSRVLLLLLFLLLGAHG